jgi:hypothetical protein
MGVEDEWDRQDVPECFLIPEILHWMIKTPSLSRRKLQIVYKLSSVALKTRIRADSEFL